MSMAASQARFLSLTARKSNVEYQGQQVNQERTALANESANLYSQLTQIDVPAPPTTSDFYKTVYSFTAKDLSGVSSNGQTASIQYTVDEIYNTPQGTYAAILHDEQYFTPNTTYIINSASPAKVSEGKVPVAEDDKSLQAIIRNSLESNYKISVGAEEFGIYLDEAENISEYLENADTQIPTVEVDGKEYYAYFVQGNKKQYISGDLLSGNGGDAYFQTQIKEATRPIREEYPVADYSKNDLGRTTDITIVVGEGDNATNVKFELNCTSVEDEDAYNKAMKDYEYYQSKYEKEVADINAKTEVIQQQDKSLELELKQLDTEQNAIKTEMDAVKEVIKNNVESSFKTFG